MTGNYSVLETKGVPVFMWNKGVSIEDAAIQQLKNLAEMPFVHHHIAAMPDTHFGIGATVGSVFASDGAVIPAAVGVDIGCGMIAAKTNIRAHDLMRPSSLTPLKDIRAEIERRVPMGRTNNGGPGDRGAWHNIPEDVLGIAAKELAEEYVDLYEKNQVLKGGNCFNHLGTLGTGNHFIEVQTDTNGNIWIMLHSGSRGIGNKIGSFFIKKAKALMEQFYIKLADKDLAYLPEGTKEYDEYLQALH